MLKMLNFAKGSPKQTKQQNAKNVKRVLLLDLCVAFCLLFLLAFCYIFASFVVAVCCFVKLVACFLPALRICFLLFSFGQMFQ